MSQLYDKVYNYLNAKITILEDITVRSNSSDRRNNALKQLLYNIYGRLESDTVYIVDNQNKTIYGKDQTWIPLDKLDSKEMISRVAYFDGKTKAAENVIKQFDKNNDLQIFDAIGAFKKDYINKTYGDLDEKIKKLEDQKEELTEKLTKMVNNLDAFNDESLKIKSEIIELIHEIIDNPIITNYNLLNGVEYNNNNLFTNLENTEEISEFLNLLSTVVSKSLFSTITANYKEIKKPIKKDVHNFYEKVFKPFKEKIENLFNTLNSVYVSAYEDEELLKVQKEINNITNQISLLKEVKNNNKQIIASNYEIPKNKRYMFINSIMEYAIKSKNNGVEYTTSMYLNPPVSVSKIERLFQLDDLYNIILIDTKGKSYEIPVVKVDDIQKQQEYNDIKTKAIDDLDSKSALDLFYMQNDFEQNIDTLDAFNYNDVENKDDIMYSYDFSGIPNDVKINEIYVNTSLRKPENNYFSITSLDHYKLNSVNNEFLLPSLYNDINNLNKFINNDHHIDNLLEKFTALYALYLCQDPNSDPKKFKNGINGKFIRNITIPNFSLKDYEKSSEYLEKLTGKNVTLSEYKKLMDNFSQLCDEFNDISFNYSDKVTYNNKDTKTTIKNIDSVESLINIYLNDIKFGFLDKNIDLSKFKLKQTGMSDIITELYDICENNMELLQPLYDLLFGSKMYSLLTNIDGDKRKQVINDFVNLFGRSDEDNHTLFNTLMSYYLIYDGIEQLKEEYIELQSTRDNKVFAANIDSVINYLNKVLHHVQAHFSEKLPYNSEKYYDQVIKILSRLFIQLLDNPRTSEIMHKIYFDQITGTIIPEITTVIKRYLKKYQRDNQNKLKV